VATYIGVLAGLAWPLAIAFCVIWIGTAYLTRISSLSALLASAITPLIPILAGQFLANPLPSLYLAGFLACLTLLIFYAHRENIGRLMRGEESRIGG